CLLDPYVYMPTNETKADVAHHRAGQKAGFTQNLESIADAQDHAAGLGEFRHRIHDRREARDRAGSQVIAVRKSSGQNNGIAVREVLRLMPNEFDRLFKDISDGVERVVVAIGPGKDDDSKFHAAITPREIGELLF